MSSRVELPEASGIYFGGEEGLDCFLVVEVAAVERLESEEVVIHAVSSAGVN